jgi:hypothetical protein
MTVDLIKTRGCHQRSENCQVRSRHYGAHGATQISLLHSLSPCRSHAISGDANGRPHLYESPFRRTLYPSSLKPDAVSSPVLHRTLSVEREPLNRSSMKCIVSSWGKLIGNHG